MNEMLSAATVERLLAPLSAALDAADTPARDPGRRQPVHLFVGGAHLFRATTAPRMGQLAQEALRTHAPDFVAFARALGLPGGDGLPFDPGAVRKLAGQVEADPAGLRRRNFPAWLAYTVYRRVETRLAAAPVESYRIDFEDGFGIRPDEAEDEAALTAAQAVADGLDAGTLPTEIGIRIKPLDAGFRARAARTLDLFVGRLLAASNGQLPPGFTVLLPKVEHPEQVATLVRLISAMEAAGRLPAGTIGIELMVETPGALVDRAGRLVLRQLVEAAGGRCQGVHFGPYDFTAALGVTAAHQRLDHPFNDVARLLIKLALSGTGVWLADGPVMDLPLGPHRSADGRRPTWSQRVENQKVVNRAWQTSYRAIQHALQQGIPQGWDIHPNQLVARYAAVYAFFRRELAANTERWRNFSTGATGAARRGPRFDDAATARSLYHYFRRAYACGAITVKEVEEAGLSLEQLETTSFDDLFGG